MTANPIFGFDDPRAETVRRLTEWAADQREREGWGDKDRSTYRYCAETLEAAAALSAGCQHVPLVDDLVLCDVDEEEMHRRDDHHLMKKAGLTDDEDQPCINPRRLYVEAEQTKQEDSDG